MEELKETIISCRKCERLVAHREAVAQKPPPRWAGWTYWARGVPGFGDPHAALWIVGLAPAAHGANRTGRMFTGDSSGDWLYRALFETGFANQPHSHHPEDGLELTGVYISAAVRCVPPDNRPLASELEACFPYLVAEWQALEPSIRIILPLGRIAYERVQRLLGEKGPPFAHDRVWETRKRDSGSLTVWISYHPSQQNTRTGRLTWPAWIAVFQGIKQRLLDSPLLFRE